jgi:hypothetical protein
MSGQEAQEALAARVREMDQNLIAELVPRVAELERALRYACGYDVAGWEAHMRPDEILAKVRVSPFPGFLAGSPAEKQEGACAHEWDDGPGEHECRKCGIAESAS